MGNTLAPWAEFTDRPVCRRHDGLSCIRLPEYATLLNKSRSLAFAVFCCWLSACGTLPSGDNWGADATLTPGAERLGRAARHNARQTSTWAPVLAATVIYAVGLDEQISEWAVENTPIFGSTDNAEHASDVLRDALVVATYGTAVALPSGDEPGEWIIAKTKGLLVEAVALEATSLTTGAIKSASGRVRPSGGNDRSFPSGHTSRAAAAARLAERNVSAMDLRPSTERAADALLVGGVAGTAWARVEAGVHYPSDVLVGAALGSFIAAFIHDSFLGLPLDYVNVHRDRRFASTAIQLGLQF